MHFFLIDPAISAGCDYLKSIEGVGLKGAYKLMLTYGTAANVRVRCLIGYQVAINDRLLVKNIFACAADSYIYHIPPPSAYHVHAGKSCAHKYIITYAYLYIIQGTRISINTYLTHQAIITSASKASLSLTRTSTTLSKPIKYFVSIDIYSHTDRLA